MADLFISHSSMDVEWTRDLRRQLESAGYSCWMAPDDVQGPTPWAEQILEAIEACRVMIVVVSRHANASAHVSKEVGAALEHDKPLLPIRTEAIVPTGSLNYLLQLVQWVDAFPGELNQHLERIRRAVAYSIPSTTGPTAAAAATATDFGAPAWSAPEPTAAPAPNLGSADGGPPITPRSAPGPQPMYGAPPTWATPNPAPSYGSPNPAPTYGNPNPPPSGYQPAAASAQPPYSPAAYAATEPIWTPAPARPAAPPANPSRTPMILAGSAGLLAAVVIIGGVLAFSNQRPSLPTPAPTTNGGFSAAPTFGPSVPPSVGPSVGPSIVPSVPPPSRSVAPSKTPEPSVFTTATLPRLIPTHVDDAVLTTEVETGDQVLTEGTGSATMRGFLAAKGKKPADLIAARGADSSGSTDLQIFLFYVPGITGEDLMAAAIASTGASLSDVQITVVTIGGRPVTQLLSSSGPPSYLYTAQGVAIVVQSDDSTLAAHAIQHTPVAT
jgi:hypothetical protein